MVRTDRDSLARELHRCAALPADTAVAVGGSHPDRLQAPPGFGALLVQRRLGHGEQLLRAATEALLTFVVLRDAGLAVAATSPRAAPGVTLVQTLGIGPVGLLAPCRVAWAAEDGDRRGFSYATLAGHPEQGEESFLVRRTDDGAILLTVSSVSRPASLAARAAGQVTRAVQRRQVQRYLDAVTRAAASAAHHAAPR